MSFQSHETLGSVKSGLDGRLQRFQEWRRERPFWGGALLMLAGLVIGWVPIQFAPELVLIGGSFTVIGLVFAAFVFLTGAFSLHRPDLSTILGISGVALSILSLLGALGGLFVGMFIGIIGGNLCVAWKHPDAAEGDGAEDRTNASAAD